jgi:hypothetical protein
MLQNPKRFEALKRLQILKHFGFHIFGLGMLTYGGLIRLELSLLCYVHQSQLPRFSSYHQFLVSVALMVMFWGFCFKRNVGHFFFLSMLNSTWSVPQKFSLKKSFEMCQWALYHANYWFFCFSFLRNIKYCWTLFFCLLLCWVDIVAFTKLQKFLPPLLVTLLATVLVRIANPNHCNREKYLNGNGGSEYNQSILYACMKISQCNSLHCTIICTIYNRYHNGLTQE